ncbi:MAG: hypothetical protein AT713_02100 [Caldivirga sp. JCHS_4]|nr:MAG: hypothetical protein AT713_02100 [Caldivirga sp. JCHS_4]
MIINSEANLGRVISRAISEGRLDAVGRIIRLIHGKAGGATLLGVSPITDYVIDGSLMVADDLKAPMAFIASLNQVDYDGGYTGYTPQSFVSVIKDKVKRMSIDSLIIISLDHCGPWLKDKHVELNLSLNEAMDECRKSLEQAIKAGYDLIHIDATIDAEASHPPEPETVAERTINLIEYAEDLRKSEGLGPLGYEVGSDRWGYRDAEHVVKLVSLILSGLKRRNLSIDVTFAVGDVGTSVKPGNRLNVNRAIELVNALSKHGILLKVHSADYIENPQDFPSIGVGGANVGPMFADLIYRRIKELALIESSLKPRESSGIINALLNELSREPSVLKYVSSIEELKSLIGDSREFLLGLMTRYVWSRDAVRHALSILKSNLRSINVDVDKELISIVMNSVKHLMLNFNLQGSLLMLKQPAT